jgi:NAD(P)-dependent dehydrogenase (short-subunit alcohol dehydrogenase family)
LGRVTHFVHSAAPPRREADHTFGVSDETWTRMRAVNVDAGFHLAREISRDLIAAKAPGSFLMLTSLHAGTPRNLPHYSTAKAALAMLVKELAKTLGRYNIRVNALVPGAIAAGGFVADPALVKHIPLGRLGRADDLAPLALAVLSDKISGYVTGTAITIDGGLALTNWFDPPELGI